MSASSERSPVSVSVSVSKREIDPLLKDLNEKKQSFRKNVVSLAVELKEAKSRLASREQSFARETLTRQEAETRARTLEEEIHKLNDKLEEKNEEIQASSGYALEYLKELDDLRSQLAVTQATAVASAASAQSAQLQSLALLKELDEKNVSVAEHVGRVNRLAEQLDKFRRDLQARESSQKQFRENIFRIEHEIMQAMAEAGKSQDSELRKSLKEVSSQGIDKLNKLLLIKDEEIAKLKDEIRTMSSHWKIKTFELESQLEKQQRADQELKKRVLKLEFCLQEARVQTRNLQRLGERRDKDLKELTDQLAVKKQQEGHVSADKQNFWETSGFKVIASMSMLILVIFSKRQNFWEVTCGKSSSSSSFRDP